MARPQLLKAPPRSGPHALRDRGCRGDGRARKNPDPTYYYKSYTVEVNGVKFKNLTREQLHALGWSFDDVANLEGKPEGVGPEFADIAIRLFETCEEYGLDLSAEIERKMAYNEGREVKHGGLLM